LTTFYDSYLLQAETTTNRYHQKGCFTSPNSQELLKKILPVNSYYQKMYGEAVEKGNLDVVWDFLISDTFACVSLKVKRKDTDQKVLTLGSVCLSTTQYNCGSLHISNLNTEFPGKGIASFILREVLKYCYLAGYSFIFMNTAGVWQNEVGKYFFERKFGFKPMKRLVYRNKRSGNNNVWYYKFLEGVTRVPYENAFEANEEDEEIEDFFEDYPEEEND